LMRCGTYERASCLVRREHFASPAECAFRPCWQADGGITTRESYSMGRAAQEEGADGRNVGRDLGRGFARAQ
jgi:hypothetical protein